MHAKLPQPPAARRSNRQRGYIMVMFTLSLFMLLGVCGLAVDMGRLYVAKSETQSFADAAALNAAVQLSVSPGGFAAAKTAATQTSKKWEFETKTFTNVTISYGTTSTDAFITTPPAPGKQASDYKFVMVTARASVPMYLLSAAIGSKAGNVAASAIAGQEPTTSLPGGEFPFSPYSRKKHVPDDPNDPFGFKVGGQYTLRWDPPGDKSTCGNDQGKVGENGDFRGYCCTGAKSAVSIREVLAGGGTVPVTVGDPFPPLETPGQKNTIDISDWVNADTDKLSYSYEDYLKNGNGNGRRIVTVVVNDDQQSVVGFAAFFLYPASEYGNKNYCGEYIGQMVQGLPGLPPGSGYGYYHLKLFQ